MYKSIVNAVKWLKIPIFLHDIDFTVDLFGIFKHEDVKRILEYWGFKVENTQQTSGEWCI